VRVLRAGALYVALTALLTYPLALRLRIMDAGDSAFFAWVMAWEAHALKTEPARLPHGNMFHPLRYTLGMDEPVFGTTLLVLPLHLLTDDAVLIFNVARLLTFVLSALTAYLLARSLGAAELPSLLAGAAFAFSPIRTDQIAHLSTLGTQYLPLVLLFLFRFFRLGTARDALLAALFFVLEAYACGYHGVVGLLVLPVAVVPLVWGRWGRLPVALGGGRLLLLRGFTGLDLSRHLLVVVGEAGQQIAAFLEECRIGGGADFLRHRVAGRAFGAVGVEAL